MANTTNFSVRMDSEIKKQCENLYNELGMNLTGEEVGFMSEMGKHLGGEEQCFSASVTPCWWFSF